MLTVLYNGVCGGGWGRLRLLANVRRYLSPCPRHIRVGAEFFLTFGLILVLYLMLYIVI
jgi:hypothetical protein